MKRLYLLTLSAALLAAPLAYGHTPTGPKNWCETGSDWDVHDYVVPGGFAAARPADSDGNVEGECDGNPNTFGDYDGHREWSFGGAWLSARNGLATNALSGQTGAGSEVCYAEYAHHYEFPTITVVDDANSLAAIPTYFAVLADYWNNVPPVSPDEPNCGDVEADYYIDCYDACTAPFPAGLDGIYLVYVYNGVSGHVSSPSSGGNGPPPPEDPPVPTPASPTQQNDGPPAKGCTC